MKSVKSCVRNNTLPVGPFLPLTPLKKTIPGGAARFSGFLGPFLSLFLWSIRFSSFPRPIHASSTRWIFMKWLMVLIRGLPPLLKSQEASEKRIVLFWPGRFEYSRLNDFFGGSTNNREPFPIRIYGDLNKLPPLILICRLRFQPRLVKVYASISTRFSFFRSVYVPSGNFIPSRIYDSSLFVASGTRD